MKPLFETISLHPYETFFDLNGLARIESHVSTLKVLGIGAVESAAPASRLQNRVIPPSMRPSRYDPRFAPYSLPPFLGPQKFFSALKSLKLSDIDAGYERLLELLLTRAGKLEEVELRNVYVMVTPWKAIIIGMGKHMRLKRVKFDGKLVQRDRTMKRDMDRIWYGPPHAPHISLPHSITSHKLIV